MEREQQWTQALAAHQAGDFARARALYEARLEQAPDDSETLYLLGMLLVQTGEAELGEERLARAVSLAPTLAVYHNAQGHALRVLERLPEALAAFERAAHYDPSFALAHENMGAVALALKDKKRAIAAWSAALTRDPQNPKIAADLASLLKGSGQWEAASSFYALASALLPDHPVILYNRFLLDCAMCDAREWMSLSDVLDASALPASYAYELCLRGAIGAWLSGVPMAQRLAKAARLKAQIGEEDRNTRNMHAYALMLEALQTLPRRSCGCVLIGDSHSLTLPDKARLILGGKAWHFAQDGENEYKRQVKDRLEKLSPDQQVAFCFGEIDCRLYEGILTFSHKAGRDPAAQAGVTARGYVSFIRHVCKGSIAFCTVPQANLKALSEAPEGITSVQIDALSAVILSFNEALGQAARECGAAIVDLHAVSGEGGGQAHLDAYHLRPDVMARAFAAWRG